MYVFNSSREILLEVPITRSQSSLSSRHPQWRSLFLHVTKLHQRHHYHSLARSNGIYNAVTQSSRRDFTSYLYTKAAATTTRNNNAEFLKAILHLTSSSALLRNTFQKKQESRVAYEYCSHLIRIANCLAAVPRLLTLFTQYLRRYVYYIKLNPGLIMVPVHIAMLDNKAKRDKQRNKKYSDNDLTATLETTLSLSKPYAESSTHTCPRR